MANCAPQRNARSQAPIRLLHGIQRHHTPLVRDRRCAARALTSRALRRLHSTRAHLHLRRSAARASGAHAGTGVDASRRSGTRERHRQIAASLFSRQPFDGGRRLCTGCTGVRVVRPVVQPRRAHSPAHCAPVSADARAPCGHHRRRCTCRRRRTRPPATGRSRRHMAQKPPDALGPSCAPGTAPPAADPGAHQPICDPQSPRRAPAFDTGGHSLRALVDRAGRCASAGAAGIDGRLRGPPAPLLAACREPSAYRDVVHPPRSVAWMRARKALCLR